MVHSSLASEVAFRDISGGIRQTSDCAFAFDLPGAGTARAAVHVKVGNDQPVMIQVGRQRWITAPGAIFWRGQVVKDLAPLWFFRAVALGYSPTTKTEDIERRGDQYWITPAGMRRHLKDTPGIQPASALGSGSCCEGTLVASFRLTISLKGLVASSEPLNGPARDAGLMKLVRGMSFKPFESEGIPTEAMANFLLLVGPSGKATSFY
jgi:hypothetical protein